MIDSGVGFMYCMYFNVCNPWWFGGDLFRYLLGCKSVTA